MKEPVSSELMMEEPVVCSEWDGEIYQPKQLDLIREFVVLGISRYTDANSVAQTMTTLKEMFRNKEGKRVISMLKEISKGGKCMNQAALLLCLVKGYLQDPQIKEEFVRLVPEICRIPTHLFMLLKMIHEDEDSLSYYKTLLNSFGSNAEKKDQQKGKKKNKQNTTSNGSNQPSEHDIITEKLNTIVVGNEAAVAGGSSRDTLKNDTTSEKKEVLQDGENAERKSLMKISSFVPKHKFIAAWYKDPKKSAEDLLYLLTKYKGRCGWDHKMLINYTHVKIPDDDEEKVDKDTVIQYYLGGIKKIDKVYKKFQVQVAEASPNPENPENPEILETPGNRPDPEKQKHILFLRQTSSRILAFIKVLEETKTNKNNPQEIINIIRKYQRWDENSTFVPSSKSSDDHQRCYSVTEKAKYSRLHITIEFLPDELYKNKEVWAEIIKDMPMTAMLKHISHISSLGLFGEQMNSDCIRAALTHDCRIYPFVHPFQILKTWLAYRVGSGRYKHGQGAKKWHVKLEILDILEEALAVSFKRKVKPLKFKKCIICVDMSSPMQEDGFLGFDMFTAGMASVVIATMIKKFEESTRIFLCGNKSTLLEKETLSEVLEEIKKYHDKESDLSLPIKQAYEDKEEVDAFIVLTKSIKESMCGESAYTAFNRYREKNEEIDTKLIICSMEANNYLIADPKDGNVFTVCGGDADVLPEIHWKLNPCERRCSSFVGQEGVIKHRTSSALSTSSVSSVFSSPGATTLQYDENGVSFIADMLPRNLNEELENEDCSSPEQEPEQEDLITFS